MRNHYVSPMIRRVRPDRNSASPRGELGEVSPAPNSDETIQKQPAAPADATVRIQPESHRRDEESPDTGTNVPPPPEESVRISEGSYKQIRDHSLVLLSQGIVHRLDRSPEGPFEIYVKPEHQENARLQLSLYIKENPPRNHNDPLPLTISLQPAWVLLVPSVFTLGDFSGKIRHAHELGMADAEKILQGEWWRTVTALTLHADAKHIVGNLISGYIVLNLMSYRIPLAKMVPFIAVASAFANFCVALTVQNDFRALGFSTFVFASIGALSVIEFRLMPRESHGLLRRFAPLFAAFSLAVFIGIGENADILGHFYGFIVGSLCGLIPQKKSLRWGAPVTTLDWIWGAFYFIIFAAAWHYALL